MTILNIEKRAKLLFVYNTYKVGNLDLNAFMKYCLKIDSFIFSYLFVHLKSGQTILLKNRINELIGKF